MLKELEQELTEPLSRIFYRSLIEGEVPEDWKTANVTLMSLIYKKKGLKVIREITDQKVSPVSHAAS